MLNKINLLIICFSIVSLSCEDIKDYSPDQIQLDTLVPSLQFPIHSKVKLEENSSNILSNINQLRINYQNKELFVFDESYGKIFVFDKFSGSLLNSITINTDYSDSVAKYAKPPYDFEWRGIEFTDFNYIQKKQFSNYNIQLNDTLMLKNVFKDCFFADTSIYILAHIKLFKISEKFKNGNTYKKGVANLPLLIEYNYDLDLVNYLNIEVKKGSHPVARYLAYDESRKYFYLVTSSLIRYKKEYKTDSLGVLMSFDTNARQIEIVQYLPDSYFKNNLYYDLTWEPKFEWINNELLMVFPYDNHVWGLGNKEKFQLYNVPYDMMGGAKYFPKYKNFVKENGINRTAFDILKNLFPILNYQIFELANHNIAIVYLLNNQDIFLGGYYFIIQEYTPEGKLLNHTNIVNEEEWNIKFITYDKQDNLLLLFKKGSLGWILEKRKWE